MDKIIGIYHFLWDKVPNDVPVVEPKPRKINQFMKSGRVLVSKIHVDTDIKTAVSNAINLLGNLKQIISRGDKILIKPNFNSPDPFPASTDLNFLRCVLEFLQDSGGKITIGESSGGVWRPTRKVFKKLGVDELARKMGIELISFEDHPKDWVKVKINGSHLKTVTMPRIAYEADRIVYLPCMKTHNLGIFSGALKLTVGFMHPGERRSLHARNLMQKIAEINLAWQPDMIIMDGRKAFITGGPDRGQIAEPGIILASGDLVAVDIEAMKTILKYQGKNRIPVDPWQLPQIVSALKYGLGPVNKNYVLVE